MYESRGRDRDGRFLGRKRRGRRKRGEETRRKEGKKKTMSTRLDKIFSYWLKLFSVSQAGHKRQNGSNSRTFFFQFLNYFIEICWVLADGITKWSETLYSAHKKQITCIVHTRCLCLSDANIRKLHINAQANDITGKLQLQNLRRRSSCRRRADAEEIKQFAIFYDLMHTHTHPPVLPTQLKILSFVWSRRLYSLHERTRRTSERTKSVI